jgi:glycopeptide antibiotics resistance protein
MEMIYRINIHEKLWPYYFGYGTIPMIIYQYSGSHIGLGTYNIYMILVIALPFMIQPRYPSRTRNYPTYPAINLTLFSYITSCIFSVSKYLAQTVRNAI